MTDQRRMTRRRMLGTTAAGATAAAIGSGRLNEVLASRRALSSATLDFLSIRRLLKSCRGRY